MTITPKITEVHERQYAFNLTPEQVQDAIISACLKAAGLRDLPEGVEFTMRTGGGFQPIDLRFTVPVVSDQSVTPVAPTLKVFSEAGKAFAEAGKAICDAVAAPAAPQPAASVPVSAPKAVEKASAAPAPCKTPVRASGKVSGRPMAWAGLPPQERSIVLHLEALPDNFSPTDDRNIAECLTGGVKATAIAAEMGVTPEEVVQRWKAMLCSAVLEGGRTPTIEGQKRLLAALRYRVETEE